MNLTFINFNLKNIMENTTKKIPDIYHEAVKATAYVERAVHKACQPDWDWEAIEKKGLKYPAFVSTFARLLIALKEKGRYSYSDNGWILEQFPRNETYNQGTEPICKWDLTKDLRDQEPKTILSIAKLLGYEK